MLLFYSYIIFSLLTFILLAMEVIIVSKQIINRYKDKIKSEKEGGNLTLLFAFFKLFLISFIPFLNVLLFLSILFCGDQITNELIDHVTYELNLEDETI